MRERVEGMECEIGTKTRCATLVGQNSIFALALDNLKLLLATSADVGGGHACVARTAVTCAC